MRTLAGFLAVSVLALAPLSASAATVVARDQLSLTPVERVFGNFYAAGGTVSVGAPVSGDLVIAGGSVAVTGPVSGDLIIAGGSIQVLGPVTGDVRILAGQVTVAGTIGGDLVVAGGTVLLLPSTQVGGDLLSAAGSVTLDGTVRGKAQTVGGMLTINGSIGGSVQARVNQRLVLGPVSRIGGALSYRAPAEATIASGAVVAGGVTFDQVASLHAKDVSVGTVMTGLAALLTGFQMLAALGFAALIVWRYRRWALEVITDATDAFWPSLGRGLVYGILTPIAALLLVVSVIGAIPGILAWILFVAVILITRALAGIMLGVLLLKLARRQPVLHLTWLGALGGTILFRLLGFIPVLGWLVSIFLTLAVFGVLAHRATKVLA